jgi:hypothetical protein
VLTVVSLTLLLAVGATVNALIPLYAIGVFTGFSMAGFGMTRYHLKHKEQGWRRRLVINMTGAIYTVLVVLIFAVVKFTEGAWIVVIVGPLLVFALIRLNREYSRENRVLESISDRQASGEPSRQQPNYSRRVVFVFVDSFDLATLAALRYARSLRPTTLRAVHFVVDSARAEKLREQWLRADRGIPLEFIDTPDRRITRAAAELIGREAAEPGTYVTAVLPRRSYSPLLGRLLHDRTADKIAGVVSRIPHSAATIIPFDVQNRVDVLEAKQTASAASAASAAPLVAAAAPSAANEPNASGPAAGLTKRGLRAVLRPRGGDNGPAAAPGDCLSDYDRPVPPADVEPIGSITAPGRATVEGRVRAVEIRPVEHNNVLAAEVSDSTGDLTALFYGRSHIPGLDCGSKVRFRGPVGIKDGVPVMINPAYELLS